MGISKNCKFPAFFGNEETFLIILSFYILREQKESDGLK